MLWGGRFSKNLDPYALSFSSSLSFDINFAAEDIEGSIAHAEMLGKTGIIPEADSQLITDGLNKISKEIHEQSWKPDAEKFEDIHSAIEARLYELIGETAGKLHTGRSRNDQVSTDLRLWVKKRCGNIISLLHEVQKTFLELAEDNINTIIPGYTHLQRAQPVSFAHHLLAYIEMLERDKQRFSIIKKLSDES